MSSGSPHRAYLLLGSNLDAERNLPLAVEALDGYGQVAAVSRVWESDPVGYAAQPRFLNAAVLLITELDAEQLCSQVIPTIESTLGRVRDPHNKYAPRTIDIDLMSEEENASATSRKKGTMLSTWDRSPDKAAPPRNAGPRLEVNSEGRRK